MICEVRIHYIRWTGKNYVEHNSNKSLKKSSKSGFRFKKTLLRKAAKSQLYWTAHGNQSGKILSLNCHRAQKWSNFVPKAVDFTFSQATKERERPISRQRPPTKDGKTLRTPDEKVKSLFSAGTNTFSPYFSSRMERNSREEVNKLNPFFRASSIQASSRKTLIGHFSSLFLFSRLFYFSSLFSLVDEKGCWVENTDSFVTVIAERRGTILIRGSELLEWRPRLGPYVCIQFNWWLVASESA